MDTPLISIVIPTYNRAKFISTALESVRAQSWEQWEIIIVDDGSTDETATLLAPYLTDERIRYIRNEQNMGIARTRNRGIAEAHGQLVAMLDSDDLWLDPEKLSAQVEYMQSHPDCVLVGTFAAVIDETGQEMGMFSFETSDRAIRRALLCRNQFVQSSILMRKDRVEAIGGYDRSFMVCDDYDLWLRLGSEGTFAVLPYPMTGYREHAGGITKTKQMTAAREHLAIIRKFKGAYPRYLQAFIKAWLRIIRARVRR